MSDKPENYSPFHERLTPQQSAKQVALFKSMFGPPYTLVAFAKCEDVQPYIEQQEAGQEVNGMELLARLQSAPSYFKVVSYMALSHLLTDWRKANPEGEWLLVITGRDIRANVSVHAENPLGFIDTPVLEKAIKHHREGGHRGTI
jgi:hypothetical protein